MTALQPVLQPNSGAAGEYTGLRLIREFPQSNHQSEEVLSLFLIQLTEPIRQCRPGGFSMFRLNAMPALTSTRRLGKQSPRKRSRVAGCMITYPSTHGIFEPGIRKMCQVIHQYGGQVYMDGANMNAQVGLTSPGFIGADICHLNLHKTFAMPHGGGGPGAGPVCCAAHWDFCLRSPEQKQGLSGLLPLRQRLLLPITYAYICLLGTAA